MRAPDLQRDLDDLIENDDTRTYISQKHRYIYISARKVASTFTLTMLHSLEGQNALPEDLRSPASSAHAMDHVHDRSIYPELKEAQSIVQLDSLIQNGYYTFTFVRHPISRVFSGWASKILDSAGWSYKHLLTTYPDWQPRPFTLTEDLNIYVREEFERFIEFIYDREYLTQTYSNNHWRPQFNSLRPDYINYNAITKIEDIQTFFVNFFQRYNMSPNVTDLNKRPNTSMVPYHPDYISDKAYLRLIEMYDIDFSTFNFSRERPPAKKPLPVIDNYMFRCAIERAERVQTLLDYISKLTEKKL